MMDSSYRSSKNTIIDKRSRDGTSRSVKQGGDAMKDLISYTAQALLDHLEEISVTEIEGNLAWVPGLK